MVNRDARHPVEPSRAFIHDIFHLRASRTRSSTAVEKLLTRFVEVNRVRTRAMMCFLAISSPQKIVVS